MFNRMESPVSVAPSASDPHVLLTVKEVASAANVWPRSLANEVPDSANRSSGQEQWPESTAST